MQDRTEWTGQKTCDYCDELLNRLRRLSEGLTGFAEDVAAKISGQN